MRVAIVHACLRTRIVFLVADRTRLAGLDEAVRFQLAWDSIENDKDQLGLDGFQARQSDESEARQEHGHQRAIGRNFLLVVATQPTPQSVCRVAGGETLRSWPTCSAVMSKKLRSDTQMAAQFAPTLLRQDLDKIPLWRDNHVSVKQLVEDYAKYPYLQQLRSSAVLVAGIQDGLARTTWTIKSFRHC